MIITHLTSVHRRNDNRVFLKECRSLAEAGFMVNLVVADGLGDTTTDGVRILDAGLKKGTRFRRMTSGVWRVFRKALATKADLFILHDPELLTVAPLLRRHGKVIFDMHENTPKQLESKEWIPRAVRHPAARVFKLLERFLLRNIPVIFAEKSYSIEYPWIKKNRTVLNMPRVGLLSTIRKAARKREVFTVGYMGEIAEKRGSITTLKALGILREKQLPFYFECIGHAEPGHEKKLRALSKELGIGGNVNFRGYMQNENGLKIMAECNVGLAVLRAVPNNINSASTKLFEYMLLGLPAIISDFPNYRQLAAENRFFYTVPPDDPSALAELLQNLMELGHCHEELEKNALLAADKYSWTEEEKKLVAFVREILG